MVILKRFYVISSLFILFALQQANAAAFVPVISLGTGLGIYGNLGRSQSFPILNPITDEYYDYTPQTESQSNAIYDFFIGGEWRWQHWGVQPGIGYSQIGIPYQVTGNFLQGADAQSSDTYQYQYKVSSKQLMAEAKLFYTYKKYWNPYLFLGVGEAFNAAYGYMTTVPPFLTFTREYQDKRINAFSYALGVGLDINLSRRVRFGFGYRYVNAGKSQLGPATIDGTSVSGTLNQKTIYTNEVLAQLSFLL